MKFIISFLILFLASPVFASEIKRELVKIYEFEGPVGDQLHLKYILPACKANILNSNLVKFVDSVDHPMADYKVTVVGISVTYITGRCLLSNSEGNVGDFVVNLGPQDPRVIKYLD